MEFKPTIVWNDKGTPSYVDSYSPSWRKPREFMQHIMPTALANDVPVYKSRTAKKLLTKVHSRSYVDGVYAGTRSNGFGGTEKSVADSCGYTCGAFVEGMLLALEGFSCCVPVSGFHHATYNGGGGFCTFNGLALAAVMAHEKGVTPGIIDCDMHYGNGTADILNQLELTMDIPHYTYGADRLNGRTRAVEFLKALPGVLHNQFRDCGVLLYQAGADPHIDDPLGGSLTTGQMAERDHIVFTFAKERGIPVVWDLAGGYQSDFSKVLALHEQTFNIWLSVNK